HSLEWLGVPRGLRLRGQSRGRNAGQAATCDLGRALVEGSVAATSYQDHFRPSPFYFLPLRPRYRRSPKMKQKGAPTSVKPVSITSGRLFMMPAQTDTAPTAITTIAPMYRKLARRLTTHWLGVP